MLAHQKRDFLQLNYKKLWGNRQQSNLLQILEVENSAMASWELSPNVRSEVNLFYSAPIQQMEEDEKTFFACDFVSVPAKSLTKYRKVLMGILGLLYIGWVSQILEACNRPSDER